MSLSQREKLKVNNLEERISKIEKEIIKGNFSNELIEERNFLLAQLESVTGKRSMKVNFYNQ